MTRITPTKAKNIKAALAETQCREQGKIAKRFKVSRSTVSDIATGRRHNDIPWPEGFNPLPNKKGGQRRKSEEWDPTNARIMELEADLVHVTEERNRERRKNKVAAKNVGLFKAMVGELDARIKPFTPPKLSVPKKSKSTIEEHLVLHLSDGHHDQVVRPEEVGGFEEYNFNISCARAENLVDTTIEWTQKTLSPQFHFGTLWVLAYGDHTSGEIHGHAHRSYYRNQIKNCLAIGQLHALMLRDFVPYFEQINVVYLPGNHGRRTVKKEYTGPQNNWDYLVAEIARLHCSSIPSIQFIIPDSFQVNLDINGVGFNLSHGDDVRSNGGIPFYAMQRKQKSLMALSAMQQGPPIRYFAMGHHHVHAELQDGNGELIVNGPWVGTDSFSYNSFSGYREPNQLLHGVNPKYGITWRLPIKLRHDNEKQGPKRYRIDGGRDIGPLTIL